MDKLPIKLDSRDSGGQSRALTKNARLEIKFSDTKSLLTHKWVQDDVLKALPWVAVAARCHNMSPRVTKQLAGHAHVIIFILM